MDKYYTEWIMDAADAHRAAYTSWLNWLYTGNKRSKRVAENWMLFGDIQETAENKKIAEIWQKKISCG
jgi:hypothetical protein